MGYSNANSFVSIKQWKKYFPLLSVKDTINLIEKMLYHHFSKSVSWPNAETLINSLESNLQIMEDSLSNDVDDNNSNVVKCEDKRNEINLAFVSIILGAIENKLTSNPGNSSRCSSPVHIPSKNKLRSSKRSAVIPLSIDVDNDLPNSSVSSPGKTVAHAIIEKSSANGTKPKRRNRRASGASLSKSRKRHFSSISIPESPLSEDVEESYSLAKKLKTEDGVIDQTLSVNNFPFLSFDEIENLYLEFFNLIVENPTLKKFLNRQEVCEAVLTRKSHSHKAVTKDANSDMLTSVCQVIHSRLLLNKFNDKLNHTQSIYSLLTNGQLDGFGLAFTVAAACQLLGYPDVWIALSEDYAWVEYGDIHAPKTADVVALIYEYTRLTSLHNVANISAINTNIEITLPTVNEICTNPEGVSKQSWLYVKNHPIRCTSPVYSLVAAVASIQPSGPCVPVGYSISKSHFAGRDKPMTLSDWVSKLSPTKKLPGSNSSSLSGASTILLSPKMVELKQNLLWQMYVNGLLSRYPVGLTNLADLEEMFPTVSHIESNDIPVSLASPMPSEEGSVADSLSLPEHNLRAKPTNPMLTLSLYYQAVHVSKCYYDDSHVYPYLYLATCLHRRHKYSSAMHFWTEAARVISFYNHSSEDTEVYKELLDVATVIMPSMVKLAVDEYRSCSIEQLATDPVDGSFYRADNILDDPQCFAYLLQFVDHLCVWEEGSSVPVLHVGWVDKLMAMFLRFTERARKLLCLTTVNGPGETDTKQDQKPESTTPEREAVHETDATEGNLDEDDGKILSTDVEKNSCTFTDDVKATNTDQNLIPVSPCATPSPCYQAPLSTASSSSVHSAVFAKENLEEDVIDLTGEVEIEVPATVPEFDLPVAPSSAPLPIDLHADREELLSSLASFCDQRLLNPAFLAGMQPTEPLLPAECVDAEQAMRDRLPDDLLSLSPTLTGDSSEVACNLSLSENEEFPELVETDMSNNIGETKAELDTTLLAQSDSKSNDKNGDLQQSFEGDNTNNSMRKSEIQYFVQLFDQTEPSVNPTCLSLEEESKTESKNDKVGEEKVDDNLAATGDSVTSRVGEHRSVKVMLRSSKMSSVVDLWGSVGRLNISAIKLALTAQSNFSSRHAASLNASSGQSSPYPSRRRAAQAQKLR